MEDSDPSLSILPTSFGKMIVAIFGLLSSLALSSGASDGYQPSSNATTCRDYSMYSTMPQGNNSAGRLGLPFMRPSPECRTFVSPAVDASGFPKTAS